VHGSFYILYFILTLFYMNMFLLGKLKVCTLIHTILLESVSIGKIGSFANTPVYSRLKSCGFDEYEQTC